MGAKRWKIELNPRLLGLNHIFIVVLRYGTCSISQNDINARDFSNVKFRVTVNKEYKRATKMS